MTSRVLACLLLGTTLLLVLAFGQDGLADEPGIANCPLKCFNCTITQAGGVIAVKGDCLADGAVNCASCRPCTLEQLVLPDGSTTYSVLCPVTAGVGEI